MKKLYILILCALTLAACTADEGVNKTDTHLRIFSIVPATGEAGSAAIISGINFTDAVVVKVGDAEARKVSVSANRIQVTLPENVPGTYAVTLTKGDETAEGADYTYVEDGKARMALVNMVPAAGYPGTETVIYGQGFGDNTSDLHVFFDEAEGEVTFSTRNIIHVKAPAHTEGDAFVTVKNSAQEGGTLRFTYKHAPVFQLLEIAPTSGKAGSTAVITGELFSAVPSENIVTINGVQAEVVSATTEKLTITLPQNPEGTYSIHLKVGDNETEGLSFTYLPKSWVINYFVGNGVNEIRAGVGGAAGVSMVQDINLAPDGKFWLNCRGKHTLMTLDPRTGETAILIEDKDQTVIKSLWQGQFNSKGSFYVAAKDLGQVTCITKEGAASKYAVTLEDGTAAPMANPMDVTFDADDIMYVAVRNTQAPDASAPGLIYRVENGKVTGTWSAPGIGTVEAGPDGKIYWGRDGNANGSMYIYALDPAAGTTGKVVGTGAAPTVDTFSNGTPGNPLLATVGIVRDIFFCKDGSMLFTEQNTATLRMLKPLDGDYTKGTVSTIAGTPCSYTSTGGGNYDGAYALSAKLSQYVYGVWMTDDMSTIYLADGFNFRINKLVMED